MTKDWPSVKVDLQAGMYDDREPLPVDIGNLGRLVASRPEGPVSTALQWSNITEEDFERMIYNIARNATGYENVQWLMHTNASDRGRDISVERAHVDTLAGAQRDQVVIQCKHWLSRSVGPTDVTNAGRKMPRIEMWPENHLESLLAERPRLVTAFRLRARESAHPQEPF